MRRPHARTARGGFTLAELLVTVTLIAVLFATAIPFLQTQARTIGQNAGRLESRLNARFGISQIDRELRSAGVNVLDDQPLVVQAHAQAITFNGDLVGRDSAFSGAVNFDPDAPADAVGGMSAAAKVRLPITGQQYPDCTFVQGGAGSARTSAETIAYWVSRDSTSPRADEHILFRRANRMAPEVVARGIVVQPGQRVFRYYRANAAGGLVEITATPFWHSASQHGSPADTAASALTDSVRVVRVQLVGRHVDRRTGRSSLDTVQTSVRLANAGLLRRKTCGEAPITGAGVASAGLTANNGAVRVVWTAMGDEGAGERDVERYVVYRRLTSESAFGEPLVSVASGQGAYEYVDGQVVPGESYVYAVAAQDCSPANSPLVQTGAVVVPATP